MSFCESCGRRLRDEARFCPACGRATPQVGCTSTDTSSVSPDSSEDSTRTGVTPLPRRVPTLAAGVPAEIRAAFAPEYEVDRLLGRGGMGSVWRARERDLERFVAIKTLPSDKAQDPTAVERFLQEARLAARLRHPGIVAIYSVGERAGIRFFTMEMVPGGTVGRYVANRMAAGQPLTTAEVRRIFREVVAAVAHGHRQGIVHRDLKPANVMVEPEGRVVVMDFGLAKASGAPGLTSSGVVVGTPRYMSPEQLRGEPATPRSGMFALGLILYFLHTGRDLVEGEQLTAVVAQVVGTDLRRAASKVASALKEDGELLDRLLAPDPANRPASLDEILTGLEEHRGRAASDGRTAMGVPMPNAARSETTLPTPPGTQGAATPQPPSATATPTPRPVAGRAEARERMKGLLDRLHRGPSDR